MMVVTSKLLNTFFTALNYSRFNCEPQNDPIEQESEEE